MEKWKTEMVRSDERHVKELEQLKIQVQRDTQTECNKTMRLADDSYH